MYRNNIIRLITLFLSLVNAGCGKKSDKESNKDETSILKEGMVWIPGGDFIMGTNEADAYEHERPAHKVRVSGFWMDEAEVTNEQFKKFVEETQYVTLAERKPTWEELRVHLPPGTPAPPDSLLIPGSLVFRRPNKPVSTNDISQWWVWTPGADWKHPEGSNSNLEGRWNHPVVHVAYEDALAYCKWSGRRLPTEAEWEFASRGGRDQQRYGWGSELKPGGKYMANTYQGSFPFNNSLEDGYDNTSPIKSFSPNEYGLHDMIGNVWEWTSDLYNVDYFKTLSAHPLSIDPKGPSESFDPNEPYATKRVSKGGSFLCSNDYCVNYRPSARQGTTIDSGSSNIGFRTVKDKF